MAPTANPATPAEADSREPGSDISALSTGTARLNTVNTWAFGGNTHYGPRVKFTGEMKSTEVES
jgi:hypothetical protein